MPRRKLAKPSKIKKIKRPPRVFTDTKGKFINYHNKKIRINSDIADNKELVKIIINEIQTTKQRDTGPKTRGRAGRVGRRGRVGRPKALTKDAPNIEVKTVDVPSFRKQFISTSSQPDLFNTKLQQAIEYRDQYKLLLDKATGAPVPAVGATPIVPRVTFKNIPAIEGTKPETAEKSIYTIIDTRTNQEIADIGSYRSLFFEDKLVGILQEAFAREQFERFNKQKEELDQEREQKESAQDREKRERELREEQERLAGEAQRRAEDAERQRIEREQQLKKEGEEREARERMRASEAERQRLVREAQLKKEGEEQLKQREEQFKKKEEETEQTLTNKKIDAFTARIKFIASSLDPKITNKILTLRLKYGQKNEPKIPTDDYLKLRVLLQEQLITSLDIDELYNKVENIDQFARKKIVDAYFDKLISVDVPKRKRENKKFLKKQKEYYDFDDLTGEYILVELEPTQPEQQPEPLAPQPKSKPKTKKKKPQPKQPEQQPEPLAPQPKSKPKTKKKKPQPKQPEQQPEQQPEPQPEPQPELTKKQKKLMKQVEILRIIQDKGTADEKRELNLLKELGLTVTLKNVDLLKQNPQTSLVAGQAADYLELLIKGEEEARGAGQNPEEGLYGDEIYKVMEHFEPFKGVYAINEIKDIPTDDEMGFILNLDPSYKKGSHWVAVYITKNDSIEYYDSYGEDPPARFMKDIIKLIEKMKPDVYMKCKINKVVQQRANSNNCGYFAMKFLIDRFSGAPFTYSSGFSNVLKSEKNITQFKKKLKKFGYI